MCLQVPMWRLEKLDTPGPEVKGDREPSDVGLGVCVSASDIHS